MTRMVYLAYPIDANHEFAALDLVRFAVEQMKERQAVGLIFDPGAAFTVASFGRIGDKRHVVAELDGLALDLADTVLAFLPDGVASVGVPTEVERAAASGKAVFVFSDIENAMMLRPRENLYLLPLTTTAVSEVVSALEMGNALTGIERDSDPLPFKLLDPEARLPTRAYADDAGFDLYTVGEHVIKAGEWADVSTGVAVEFPSYVWGQLVGRSSTWRNLRLNVIHGVIDPGYRGPLFAAVHNPTNEPVTIQHHTRLAQLIVMSNATRAFYPLEVERLNPSPRGENGFGSSGA